MEAVVVDCQHCGDRMKMSLPKKKIFFKGNSHFTLGPIYGWISVPMVTILP